MDPAMERCYLEEAKTAASCVVQCAVEIYARVYARAWTEDVPVSTKLLANLRKHMEILDRIVLILDEIEE